MIRVYLQKDVGSDGFAILTYGEITEEWKEANANMGARRKELRNQIELRMALGELGEKLNSCGEDNIWKASGGDNRKEEVGGDFTDNSRGMRRRKCFRRKTDMRFRNSRGDWRSRFARGGRRFRAILGNAGPDRSFIKSVD